MTDRLKAVQTILKEKDLDGFLVPNSDRFNNEYIPDSERCLTWLTEFDGSAGFAVVLKKKAAFFTDGRYVLQAADQVNAKSFEIHNTADVTPKTWLEKQGGDLRIGADPWLTMISQMNAYEQSGMKLEYQDMPIYALWEDRPDAPASKVWVHPSKFSGVKHEKKIDDIADELKAKKVDALLISRPDSLCWLLNIRGADVLHTPLVLAYALVFSDGKVKLFIDEGRLDEDVIKHLGKKVQVKPEPSLEAELETLSDKTLWVDENYTPVWFKQKADHSNIALHLEADPCQLPKGVKNDVEVKGTVAAHNRDGVALTKFLHWLDETLKAGEKVTELGASNKLYQFRASGEHFWDVSFDTISGYGSNGAVIHYRVSEKSNKTFDRDTLYLVDSGGNYFDGTTDVTRTIAVGEPSADMIKHYTLVLKGHIALASAIFPEGTTGAQLDVLARQFLWQKGVNYDHGTGHGVGSFLGVHEGPQGISKLSKVPLQPGMILSNEPGYYEAGEYGIRIENLVMVEKADIKGDRQYYKFSNLTKVPLERELIDVSMLTAGEKNWINNYHKEVFDVLVREMDKNQKTWLEQKAAEL